MENIWKQEEKVTGLRRRIQNWVILIYIGMLPETFHYLRRQEIQSEMGGGRLTVTYTYVIRMFHCILLPYLDCLVEV